MNAIYTMLSPIYDQTYRIDMPLIRGGPVKLATVIATWFVFVEYIGPLLMSLRKPFELRFFMLVFNSWMLAVNSFGFFVGLILLQVEESTWNCSVRRQDMSFGEQLQFYLAYIFIIEKLLQLTNGVIDVLRKKRKNQTLTRLNLIGDVCISYLVFILNPGGTFIIPCLSDLFVHIFVYTYYVLSSPGPMFRQWLGFRAYIDKVMLGQGIVITLHALLILPSSCEVPGILKALLLAKGLLLLLFINRDAFKK